MEVPSIQTKIFQVQNLILVSVMDRPLQFEQYLASTLIFEIPKITNIAEPAIIPQTTGSPNDATDKQDRPPDEISYIIVPDSSFKYAMEIPEIPILAPEGATDAAVKASKTFKLELDLSCRDQFLGR